MTYVFIVNGREDKASIRQNVEEQIAALHETPKYEIYATKASGDATEFVCRRCLEHPAAELCFVACGGDGTICEVASGIMRAAQQRSGIRGKKLAVLSQGTGNDFVKYYEGSDFHSVEALLKATETKIDIIRIGERYSINVTNFGFDSVVGRVGGRLAAKGWKNPYRFGIVAAILKGRFNRIDVVSDGEKIGGKRLLLCTLANNHYVGGEFFCAPRAKNDDGLIDVCLIKTMPLLGFLQILPVYTAGRHLDDPKFAKRLVYRQAKHIEVSAKKSIDLCLDGEMVSGERFEVDIIPQAISFMIP